MRSLSLRAIFLIGFVIAMPILALPAVARRLDDWIYGPPPSQHAVAPLQSETEAPIEPQLAEQASPASFDEIDPASIHRAGRGGLDAHSPAPPLLSAVPVFPPLVTAPEGASTEAGPSESEPSIGPLSDAVAHRLQQIRGELEQLGADYIVLETSDCGASYRFHCDVRVDPATRYTRPFEAVSPEPLAAAERVLAEVSAWRTAARTAAQTGTQETIPRR
jgi:hypothetical protein